MGSDEAKLAYAALMIGKETIAFNEKVGLMIISKKLSSILN